MGNKSKQTKLALSKSRKRLNQDILIKARTKRLCKENTTNMDTDNIYNIQNETNYTLASTSQTNLVPEVATLSQTTEATEWVIEAEVPLETSLVIEGRRIIDFQYFLEQLKTFNNHNKALGCTIDNLNVIKERKDSLKSSFIMKCNMCNMQFQLFCSKNSITNIDVNQGAVTGALMIGTGKSNLNEMLASIDLPILSQRTYEKCHDEIATWWKSAAEASMQAAAQEEASEATEIKDGIPVISVIADCCWSKRSYKNNYSAASGVAAIIGYRTGKVLYIGVKNKYCVICARAVFKNVPPAIHECFKNHTGSSTSMEQSVIVEGFKTSVARQNVMYGTLIADGDASTYKNILESRPYVNYQVQKIECTNHLLRNYSGKIMNLSKDTSIFLRERRFLTADRQKRLRTAVKQAVRFRKAQNVNLTEQIINLKKDILNSPSHIFGDHRACENYYCSENRKNEENLKIQAKVLFKKVMEYATQLAFHSKSLIYNVTNNRAEQFNSIVAKLVGGKRVNFSLKNSYAVRCHAAVVSFNTAQPQYTIYKSKFQRSPGNALKRLEMARLKRKQSRKQICRPKRRLLLDDKADYGEECQKPDMSHNEYEAAKNTFLQNLQEQVNNREEVERDTILQAESALWLELRRCLLTASSFGKVCKRRKNISSAPLVKSHLYSYSLDHVSSIRHGKNNEAVAIAQLESQENIKIHKCGLFIDKKFFFLGASPDGVFEKGIVEIKCPISAYGINANDGIKSKKIKFWNSDGSINKKHEWFFQIQGQLHIADKNTCVFAVWTGKELPMKVEKITRDDTFWENEMKHRLLEYYDKCLLPEIVDPRKPRSMPLRCTPF